MLFSRGCSKQLISSLLAEKYTAYLFAFLNTAKQLSFVEENESVRFYTLLILFAVHLD